MMNFGSKRLMMENAKKPTKYYAWGGYELSGSEGSSGNPLLILLTDSLTPNQNSPVYIYTKQNVSDSDNDGLGVGISFRRAEIPPARKINPGLIKKISYVAFGVSEKILTVEANRIRFQYWVLGASSNWFNRMTQYDIEA